MEIKTENLSSIAKAMSDDIRAIRAGVVFTRPPFAVNISSEHNFVVDLANFQFKSSRKDSWKGFELPYLEKDECRKLIKRHLSEWARRLGGNAAMERLLLQGGQENLTSFARLLQNEGAGTLAALTIDEIMHAVARESVQRYKAKLEASSSLWRILRNAWLELMRLATRFLFGDRYESALRKGSFMQVTKALRSVGAIVLAGLALVD